MIHSQGKSPGAGKAAESGPENRGAEEEGSVISLASQRSPSQIDQVAEERIQFLEYLYGDDLRNILSPKDFLYLAENLGLQLRIQELIDAAQRMKDGGGVERMSMAINLRRNDPGPLLEETRQFVRGLLAEKSPGIQINFTQKEPVRFIDRGFVLKRDFKGLMRRIRRERGSREAGEEFEVFVRTGESDKTVSPVILRELRILHDAKETPALKTVIQRFFRPNRIFDDQL
ncbi:MAG: hypothetical protein AAB551_01930 [Patescibacteria group bacterium]